MVEGRTAMGTSSPIRLFPYLNDSNRNTSGGTLTGDHAPLGQGDTTHGHPTTCTPYTRGRNQLCISNYVFLIPHRLTLTITGSVPHNALCL